MNKKQKDVKDAINEIKAFKVVAIIVIAFGVFLLILSAWAWGLVTAAKEVPDDLFWKADVVPIIGTVFSCIVLIIGACSLRVTGKVRKALQHMNPDEADE